VRETLKIVSGGVHLKTLIKFIVGIIAALLLLIVGGAYLLPSDVTVMRQAQIKAPPEKVFELVGSFKRFNEWSPWAALDPQMAYTFEGPETGVGSKMKWASNNPNVGKGSQEITEISAPQNVTMALDFGEMGKSEAKWTLEPKDGGTLASWNFHMKAEGVMNRWLGLMMDRFIGPDYEKGLANVKAIAEKEAGGG
jgi:uncharacterized protein YndB with AHSA1/START domain